MGRDMEKVLITGGAGFIGLHLAARLAGRGLAVDILDNFARGVRDAALAELASRQNVRVLDLDLLDPSILHALDQDYGRIFHLGAIIGVRHVLERPYAVLRDNATMTMAALEIASRQRALGRLVFASTSEVYAGTLRLFDLPIPTPENSPLALTPLAEPRTSYMLSKLHGEAMVLHSGVPCAIVRPHNVYGPRMGMSHVIPELLQRAHDTPDGGELTVYSVSHTRTFCYVEDAAAMLEAIATSPDAAGQTFNLGVQAPEISMGQLAALVCETVGKRLTIAPMPATPGSPARRAPETSLLQAACGAMPLTPLEQGLRRTYRWYREHVFSGKEVSAA